MDTMSRAKTGTPTFQYAMKYYSKEITDGIKSRYDDYVSSDEMEPWGVFNKLI